MSYRLRCQLSWQRVVPWLVAVFVLGLISSVQGNNWANEKDCQGCHSSVYQQWQKSHHANAMVPTTRATLDDLPVSYTIGYEPLQQFLRSEEHTSELQSRPHLVCRLLLEKKKTLKRL